MATAQSGVVSIATDVSVNGSIASAHAKELPKQAQDRIRALTNAWAKNSHMRGALFDMQQEARARKSELSMQIDHLRRTMEAGNALVITKADHQRLADWEAEREAETQTIAALQADMANLPGTFDPATITSFLASTNRRFKTLIPAVNARKGQSTAEALAEIRNEISDSVDEIEKVKGAHLPSNEAIGFAVAEIERLAAKGAPYFGRCRITESGANGNTRVGDIRWPKIFDDNGAAHGDAFTLLVALNKDSLIAKAKADLKALDDGEGVSLADRAPRVAEIEALILSLERKEEALIQMLEREGAAVSRRSTMNPMAILQIEQADRAPPVTEAAPEPEPETTEAERAADVKRARLRDRNVRSVATDGADPDDFG